MFRRRSPSLTRQEILKKEAIQLLKSEARFALVFSRLLWGTILLSVVYASVINISDDIRQNKPFSPYFIPAIPLTILAWLAFKYIGNKQPTLGCITDATLKRVREIINELQWPELIAVQDEHNILPIYIGGRLEHHLRLKVTDMIHALQSESPIGMKFNFDDIAGTYIIQPKPPENRLDARN